MCLAYCRHVTARQKISFAHLNGLQNWSQKQSADIALMIAARRLQQKELRSALFSAFVQGGRDD